MGRTAIDITGQRFGMLTAVRPTEERKGGNVVWEFRCDCGNTVFRALTSVKYAVKHGVTPNCGCVAAERKAEKERLAEERKVKRIIEGKRFGKLIAVRPTEERTASGIVWEFRCDCGNTVYRALRSVMTSAKSGNDSSCGCVAAERKAEKERLAEERKAEKERLSAERKAEKERLAEERRAKKERLAAERKAEKERLAEERKAKMTYAGDKFGMLTAVRPTEERKGGNVVWEFRCDCGNVVYQTIRSVKGIIERGGNPNCGCVANAYLEKRNRLFAERDAENKRIIEERRNNRQELFAYYLNMRRSKDN